MSGFDDSKLTEYQLMMKKVLEDEEKSKQPQVVRLQSKKRENLILFEAPPLRVVAYDPKTKFRDGVIIPPEAVLELAGGGYSPFLSPDKRRELGRLICESLQLEFLRPHGFKLTIPWSGIKVGGRVKTNLWKISQELKSLNRPGRIFQNALRITRYNILVTVYCPFYPTNRDVTFNFRSTTCSNDIDIDISEKIQIEYMTQTFMSFVVGESRNIAIINFCKCFDATIYVDPTNYAQKLLDVTLLPKRKQYVISYRDIGLPKPEEDLRSIGIPEVFMPPDATGILLYRFSKCLYHKETGLYSPIEYIISIFSKSPPESVDRGVVIKVYSTIKSQTMVLHYGPSELMRLCLLKQHEQQQFKGQQFDETNNLINEIITLQNIIIENPKDSIEEHFLSLTEKGENLEKIKRLISILCHIIVDDIGIQKNSQGDDSLYSKTSAYEPK